VDVGCGAGAGVYPELLDELEGVYVPPLSAYCR
jgi:hypothetical protein